MIDGTTALAGFPAALRALFHPLRLLGRGGFGSVWLAQQKTLDRPVALKTLNADLVDTDEQVQRFQDEARLTASIRHPGVVTLLDHGVAEGMPWMAFEFVEGQSLRSWVQAGPSPWRAVLEVGRQVAIALEEARTRGVIHRDIKPDNILQTKDGQFKVADFGIAKWAGNTTRTADGMVLGTPAYLSPQQVKGHLPAHQSDLYALGITLYELLTARTPFLEENPILMLERHITSTPPPVRDLVPEVPEGVEKLIHRLLSKDRESRIDTGADLARLLGELLEKGPPEPGTRPVGLASGRAKRPGMPSSGGVTRVASVRVATPFATRVRRGPLGHILVALAVCALVLGALALQAPPAVKPPASPSPSAAPAVSTPAPAREADFAELREIETLAIELRATVQALISNRPDAVEAAAGNPENNVRRMKLPGLVKGFNVLLSRALGYGGPEVERVLIVGVAGVELLHAADVLTAEANLASILEAGRASRHGLELDHTRSLLEAPPRDVYRRFLVRLMLPRTRGIAIAAKDALSPERLADELGNAAALLEGILDGLPPPGPLAGSGTLVLILAQQAREWFDLARVMPASSVTNSRYSNLMIGATRRLRDHLPRVLAAVAAGQTLAWLDEVLDRAFWTNKLDWNDQQPESRLKVMRVAESIAVHAGPRWLRKRSARVQEVIDALRQNEKLLNDPSLGALRKLVKSPDPR